jgi:cytoskeletal protein RodZ
MERKGSKAAMEKEGSKAASASSAAFAVLHAENAEAEASATASEAELLVKEPEVEDLKEGGAQGSVAAADLKKPEAEAAVVEEGGVGAAAPAWVSACSYTFNFICMLVRRRLNIRLSKQVPQIEMRVRAQHNCMDSRINWPLISLLKRLDMRPAVYMPLGF